MLVILDSNVLAAAVGGSEASPPFRVMLRTLQGLDSPLVSSALTEEYTRVLNKPRLFRRHGLAPAEVSQVVTILLRNAVRTEPRRSTVACPDPKDQMLWDLLDANADAILVTGETALQSSDSFPGRVLSPRAYMNHFGA